MKIQNLTIGTQLRIGLGMIIIFVILLGAATWFQAESIWSRTDHMYKHPLRVRRAIAELKTDVLLWDRNVKDVVRTEDIQERQEEITRIAFCETDALRQLDSISLVYLGPQRDVTDIINAWVRMKLTREDIVGLIKEGKFIEANRMIYYKGSEETAIDNVLKEINDISVFSFAKADQLYKEAKMNKENLQNIQIVLLLIILFLSFVISYLLIRIIRTPIDEMIKVNEDYRKGNLNSRVSYGSKNEFGELAASFNRLAETNQAELRNREMVGRVTDVMLQEEELHSFCHSLIIRLLEATTSQIGAIYLLNNLKTDFEPFESIGLSPEKRSAFSAVTFDGEFGLALSSRQIQVIRNIPVDTPMLFSTSAGDFRPREIITIPIPSAKEVVAMISLASVSAYSSEAIRIIKDTHITLVARFNGVLAHQKILDFTEKLEVQNRELDERSRELAIQGNELTEQNLELEIQKQQLDEANRLKSSFLSNMSHELRTPLNSVIALAGVLNRRLRLTIPEEEYNYLEIIERNGKNLLSLINDILDLSRIEAGHEEVSFGNFSIYDVVDEVVSMIEAQARDKNIELVNKVSRELPLLRSDYVKCRHILQNIISNAVKFTEKGKVEINAVEAGDEMLISITDTGIGISEGDLPYIFDEFRQADEGSSRKFGGTGLGLAIAKKFTDLLEGEISVESKPGQGTTFMLRLPLTPGTEQFRDEGSNVSLSQYVQKNGSPETIVSGKGKTILVVEDSEPAIIQIREILSEQGFSVSVARNGREAMEQIRQSLPDAMILDLMMPEVDGFQVLGMIRENPETSTIPVLILTAKHITKEELKFLKGNNIHQFIQKGDIGRLELLATIDEMVNPEVATQFQPKPRQARKPGSGKPVVLIVEDNPDNMKSVKALLPGDHTILEAVDGAAGVDMAIKHKPDLILMDLSLPIMDGFSAFKKIRMVESLKDVPIIAVTARAMKGSREEILESGFDDYISKPIDESLFKRIVRYYLYGDR